MNVSRSKVGEPHLSKKSIKNLNEQLINALCVNGNVRVFPATTITSTNDQKQPPHDMYVTYNQPSTITTTTTTTIPLST